MHSVMLRVICQTSIPCACELGWMMVGYDISTSLEQHSCLVSECHSQLSETWERTKCKIADGAYNVPDILWIII